MSTRAGRCTALLVALWLSATLAFFAAAPPAMAQSTCVFTAAREYRIAQVGPLCVAMSDGTIVEGDAEGVMEFEVRKTYATAGEVLVTYATSDGTAIAGQDYKSTSGSLYLTGDTVSATIQVPILGDDLTESNETFFLDIVGSSAMIDDGRGIGTIVDDDPAPSPTPPPPSPSPSPAPLPPPAPPAPIPQVSQIPIPSVVAPSPVSSPKPSPAPSPSPSPSPSPKPAPTEGTGQSVAASAPQGGDKAPPGGGLEVSAQGFGGCVNVLFRFDDIQVGSAFPDRGGRATASGLSVPAQAVPGSHRITARCEGGGRPAASTRFEVVDAPIHRTALVAAVPQPDQVSTDPGAIGLSILAALVAIVLVAVPAELFNSALDENRDEIRAFLHMGPSYESGGEKTSPTGTFILFVLAGGLLYALLSPGFGADPSSFALVTGMAIALAVTSVGFGFPKSLYMKVRYGEWGRLAVVPSTLAVSAIFVLLSLTVHLNPGLIYGVVAGLVFKRELDDDQQGRLTALSALFMLLLCVAAWFTRVQVSKLAEQPDAGFLILTLEAALTGIVLVGLESLTIGLIPLKALTGRSIASWSFLAWMGVFTLTVAAFVHILLTPSSGYVSPLQGRSGIIFVILAGLFAAGSIGFWAFFEYRGKSD